MIISYGWLSQYVDLPSSPEELSRFLTMAGLEVEAVWDRFAFLDTVVVGRILSCSPHPNADKLSLCQVEAGDRTVTVVCGAPNAAEGIAAPLALPGTRLPDGTVVAAADIRGQRSEGMLCSQWELGLGQDASGLMELAEPHFVGEPLNKVLSLSDPCLELSITPNRPDCLSLLGVAREVAAATGQTVKPPDPSLPAGEGDIAGETSITIDAPELCPRYSARMVRGIRVGPSPFWLADRLISVGQRPINNIVDVTNYVMLETGQPLHAFDFDLLEEGRIVVRTAKKGERFTTLDSRENELSEGMLLICDGKKPVALAGVMGGKNSEVSETTTNVLIESAHFDPASIRKTARRLGYHTEASHRFERGTDPDGTLFAADRAARLMLECAGGTLVQGVADAHPLPRQVPRIKLSVKRVNAVLGTDIPDAKVRELLGAASMEIVEDHGDLLTVSPPGFRPDVTRPEDLVEEVARLWGYDNIPVTSPTALMDAPPAQPGRDFAQAVQELAVGMGFWQTIQYSFASADSPDRLDLPEGDDRRRMLPIRNPLTEDQAVMRTSLLPGLLDTVARNINMNNRDLWLFEMGKVFFSNQGRDVLPDEHDVLALVMTGSRPGGMWGQKPVPCDFYDMKGACEELLLRLGAENPVFSPLDASDCGPLRPGRSARVTCGGDSPGVVGEVKPQVAAAWGVKVPVYYAEFAMDRLLAACTGKVRYRPLPKFPATSRDVTLILDKRIRAGDVLARAAGAGHEWVEDARVVDLYEGDPVPEDKKSLSVRITYRSSERTLLDEEVNELHQSICEDLIRAFGAHLPG
ncbi:MAG: phenylalanine--tRNA ligase subunit beta [Deltaproteobacteria bacterium]|nr:phenylalanine--tRNA ligase subunit beta [Deltaproteobacteria bacterium]